MDRSDRPEGRKKRVGSGVGKVFRRGEGVGGQTGGPVGETGGYADRTEGQSGGPAGADERDLVFPKPGGTPSGGPPTVTLPPSAPPSAPSGAPSPGGGIPGGGIGTGGPGGAARRPGIGCSPKLLLLMIVIVAIVAVVVYLMSRGSGGTVDEATLSTTPTTGLTSATSIGPTSTLSASTSTVATSIAQGARAKRTVLKGNGNDQVTVMVYMCGTDLESQSGMATADLNEMLYARDSAKLNIVVETGGTASWRNSVISNRTNQRWHVTAQGLELVQDNLGLKSMVDPATLSDFIQYCKKEYPANRYMLVFWDHGGGSLTGYGYDQNFKKDSMTLPEIATALKNGGCTFDVIGFDACLMSTLETALVLEPYGDYMVASEETEPGIGWYYTGWVTALAENTSIPTTDLGKKLIDDYVAKCREQAAQNQATLALIDLAELKGTVPSAFAAFAKSTNGLLDADSFKTVSDARAQTKEFAASSQINQIDLIHFAENLGTAEGRTLVDVLRGCIKYNRTSTNITNANGVSIYFPYNRLSTMDSMLQAYDQIGIPAEYRECIRSYASVAAGGQITSSGGGISGGLGGGMLGSLLGSLLGGAGGGSPGSSAGSSGTGGLGDILGSFLSGGDLSGITGLAGGGTGWLDVDRMKASVPYYEANRFDASALVITEKGGQRVISLPDEQWDLVQFMEMNVFLDDGGGFIDLGLDNVYEYNDSGDLVMEYDGTWLALNGQIVSYYLVSDDHAGDSYLIKGRVPALLNGQPVDIIIAFTDDAPDGVVMGAQPRYDSETETGTVARGLIDIVAGDAIDYLCDYYTYDGDFTDTYYLGERYIATGQWQIENLSVGDMPHKMTYRFTDIYGNRYWTPAVSD